MDYSVLTDELRDDPLSRNYATMTPKEVVASLRLKNRSVLTRTVLSEQGLYAALGPMAAETVLQKFEVAAQTDALGSLKAIAARAVRWLRTDNVNGGLDFGNVASQTMIDAFAEAGVFTADEAASLKSLGTTLVSRAEELGIADVGDGDIVSAREVL